MKWLVTAFSPFNGASTNSSLIVVDHLRKKDWQGRFVFHAPVPVEFNRAWSNVRQVLDQSGDFTGVLALGQAKSRERISLERVALNWIDARHPDNAGLTPSNVPIQTGPDLFWSNIPWDQFRLSPHTELSYSAGTYVCNSLMYQSLDWALAKQRKAGFIHLPVLSSQKDLIFETSPRLEDQIAVQEVERVMEFLSAL